jgi:hypothetical protein
MGDHLERIPDDRCVRCRSELTDWGIHDFRTGGITGGKKLLFGEWGELGEELVQFHLRYCSACGQVDIRLPAPSE